MQPKTPFEVTEKAGLFVAGIRSPGVGKTVSLTAEQAEYPLLAGEIKRAGDEALLVAAPAPKTTKAKE